MIRTIKLLALTALAAMAVTAVAASAAQASPTIFTAGSTSGTLTATQTSKQVFNTKNGNVECGKAHQQGTFTTASFTEITMTPTYEECKAFGFASATVTTTGCTYTYTGTEETLGDVDVVCTNNNKITVSTSGCTTTVGSQGPLSDLKYANSTGVTPDDVTGTATLSGITYTAASGCPFFVGTSNTGTLTGGSTIIAKNTAGAQVSLTVDP